MSEISKPLYEYDNGLFEEIRSLGKEKFPDDIIGTNVFRIAKNMGIDTSSLTESEAKQLLDKLKES